MNTLDAFLCEFLNHESSVGVMLIDILDQMGFDEKKIPSSYCLSCLLLIKNFMNITDYVFFCFKHKIIVSVQLMAVANEEIVNGRQKTPQLNFLCIFLNIM